VYQFTTAKRLYVIEHITHACIWPVSIRTPKTLYVWKRNKLLVSERIYIYSYYYEERADDCDFSSWSNYAACTACTLGERGTPCVQNPTSFRRVFYTFYLRSLENETRVYGCFFSFIVSFYRASCLVGKRPLDAARTCLNSSGYVSTSTDVVFQVFPNVRSFYARPRTIRGHGICRYVATARVNDYSCAIRIQSRTRADNSKTFFAFVPRRLGPDRISFRTVRVVRQNVSVVFHWKIIVIRFVSETDRLATVSGNGTNNSPRYRGGRKGCRSWCHQTDTRQSDGVSDRVR